MIGACPPPFPPTSLLPLAMWLILSCSDIVASSRNYILGRPIVTGSLRTPMRKRGSGVSDLVTYRFALLLPVELNLFHVPVQNCQPLNQQYELWISRFVFKCCNCNLGIIYSLHICRRSIHFNPSKLMAIIDFIAHDIPVHGDTENITSCHVEAIKIYSNQYFGTGNLHVMEPIKGVPPFWKGNSDLLIDWPEYQSKLLKGNKGSHNPFIKIHKLGLGEGKPISEINDLGG